MDESYILEMIEKRNAAKQNKDYATADAIRNELLASPTSVLDSALSSFNSSTEYDITNVYIKNMTQEEIKRWVNTGNAFDKAGGNLGTDGSVSYMFERRGSIVIPGEYDEEEMIKIALEYIENHNNEKPFFMFISQLEPHHQNDHGHFEGPIEAVEKYRDYPIPDDLSFLEGDYKEEYPDYIAAINRLDENVGKLVDLLKEKAIYDNTIIIYTSDHGCHFKTRNFEYKRSCHDSCAHTPLVFGGGAVNKAENVSALASLIDLPPTMLDLAGITIPENYSGNILPVNKSDVPERDCVFIQISESHIGRAVRTKNWKYSAKAIGSGWHKPKAKHYFDDFLYDLKNDPCEKNNLVNDENYSKVIAQMRALLSREMINAGEKKPVFHKAIKLKIFNSD